MARHKIISASHQPYSQKFQWLPCDVGLIDEEPGCRITSYINNLHPVKHRDLYGVLEKVIARAIPLWKRSMKLRIPCRRTRFGLNTVESLGHLTPLPGGEDNRCDDQRRRGSADLLLHGVTLCITGDRRNVLIFGRCLRMMGCR